MNERRWIFDARCIRWLRIGALATILSSCALSSSYVQDPGIDIERISTRTARIVSAGFWLDGERPSLRGEVVSEPVSKGPLFGHLDVEIAAPGQASVTCLTARARHRPRRVRKPYSVPLNALPPPGSTVRVWHHRSAAHTTCASSRPPSSTVRNGGSSI